MGEVVPCQTATVVGQGQSDYEDHADHGDYQARSANQDSIAETVTEIAAKNQGDNLDCTAGRAIKKALLRCVAERDYELAEEVADTAVGDITGEGEEDEGPGQGVEEGLFQLVDLEMLVSNSLLIDANSFDGQAPVIFAEPACIELIVWDQREEKAADSRCQKTCDKEHNLPRRNGCAV